MAVECGITNMHIVDEVNVNLKRCLPVMQLKNGKKERIGILFPINVALKPVSVTQMLHQHLFFASVSHFGETYNA